MIDGSFRGAIVLAKTELVTTLRRLRRQPGEGIATLVVIVVIGFAGPLLGRETAASFGRQLASGTVPTGTGGALLAGWMVVGAFLGLASGTGHTDGGDAGALVRTSVPPRVVSFARMLVWAVGGVVAGGPAGAILLSGVAAGAGTVLVVPLVLLATIPVLTVGVILGRILGFVVSRGRRWLDLSLWTEAVVSLLVLTGVYLAPRIVAEWWLAGSNGSGSASFPALLPGRPLQAFFGTVFAPFGGAITPVGLLTGLGFLLTIPVGILAVVRVERSRPGRDVGGEDDAGPVVTSSRTVPRPFSGTPSTRMAWRYLLRTRRDPRMLHHVVSILGVGATMVIPFVDDPGDAVGLLPAVAIVAGGTLGGASYCLNPLGGERDQLPLVLTSSPSPSVLLRGRLVAGISVGLVIAVGIGFPASVVRYSIPSALLLSIFAVFLTVVSAGTALGMGAVAPSFERQTVMGAERSHPNHGVVLVFLFGGILVGYVGLAILEWTIGGPPADTAAIAWALYVAIVGGVGLGGYVYAARQFDALTIDRW
jgi:hypothetical protein